MGLESAKAGPLRKSLFKKIIGFQNSQKLQTLSHNIASGDFHDINGTTYYIDHLATYREEDARSLCRKFNMTMVDFSIEEKWTNMVAWLQASDIG